MPQVSIVIQQPAGPRLRIDVVCHQSFPTALGPAGARVLAAACSTSCRFQQQCSAQQGDQLARRSPTQPALCTALHLSGLSLSALLDPTMACITAIVTEPFKLSAAASPRDRFMIGAGVMAACATLTAAAVTHLGDGHRCMFQTIKKSANLFLRRSLPSRLP